MEEFYMTYENNNLRWNGVDLFTKSVGEEKKKLLGESKKTYYRGKAKFAYFAGGCHIFNPFFFVYIIS